MTMKITVPEKWMEAADRFEAEGIELAVIGRPKPTPTETQEFLEKARQILLQLKIELPADLPNLKFSPEALTELRRQVADILRAAAARAGQAKHSQVSVEDIRPQPHG
jgi:hypothetical protein